MRFVVTEIEGYRIAEDGPGRNKNQGLSCQVIDTMTNDRVIAIFRSEEAGGTHARALAATRHFAAVRCAELNGEPRPRIAADSAYQPVCRRCKNVYRPDQYYCKCGMAYDLSLVA